MSESIYLNEGKSAYEIWLDQGNRGTEADFLESLRGPSGYSGGAGELEVVNDLSTGGSTAALSAEMGKQLDQKKAEETYVDSMIEQNLLAIGMDSDGNITATYGSEGNIDDVEMDDNGNIILTTTI